MTPDAHASLRRAIGQGGVNKFVSEIERIGTEDPELSVFLSIGGELRVDRLVCATGFKGQRPGSRWLGRFAAERSLPLSPCGYPVLDRALRWHPRIHVSGALAELELGPVARNIAGARRAGERTLGAL